ncbi:3599_t:CDS:1, partial [Scutellospora calospora]
ANRFEDIYLCMYYFSSNTEQYLLNNKTISNTENNILVFENHIDKFFEYATKQNQVSKNELLFEINQYLEEPIAAKTTNIFK